MLSTDLNNMKSKTHQFRIWPISSRIEINNGILRLENKIVWRTYFIDNFKTFNIRRHLLIFQYTPKTRMNIMAIKVSMCCKKLQKMFHPRKLLLLHGFAIHFIRKCYHSLFLTLIQFSFRLSTHGVSFEKLWTSKEVLGIFAIVFLLYMFILAQMTSKLRFTL